MFEARADSDVPHLIRERMVPWDHGGLEAILSLTEGARFVLLGEASHGTQEFYATRAELTRRLIADHGFDAVAVEADWADALRVHRYVQGRSADRGADEALGDFNRFPVWMWRNTEVLHFVRWLRGENLRHRLHPVGFYGLDVYGLHRSIAAVIGYLEEVDPEGAERARRRYGCFDILGDDEQAYGYATHLGLRPGCEDEAILQLTDLQRRAGEYLARDGRAEEDEQFFAEQHARLVRDAEAYYRTMFRSDVASWNLRDQHMAETLGALEQHLSEQRGRPARIVVWAHNSHLGDARATSLGARGELNLGQLTRACWPDETVLIGFSTSSGTVTCANHWNTPTVRKLVRPGLPESWEAILHQVGEPRFALDLRAAADLEVLQEGRLQRAIGVIYRPETERSSHYFTARLGRQFDGLIYFDETRAVEPLERVVSWDTMAVPETFPFAE